VASGHRPSFEDAIRERVGALEQQRQVIAREAQGRLSEIERVAIEELEMLEHAAADKTAEIHWLAAEQRGVLDQTAAARSAELERAATAERAAFEDAAASEVRRIRAQAAASRDDMRKTAAQEAAAFEDLAGKRLVELEDALQAQFQALRSELVDEAQRIQGTAVERLEQARSLVTSATGRIEESAATPDDTRRPADVQRAALDTVTSGRALELQEAVREHIELLDELNGLHASASEELDKARALTDGALRSGIEALGNDIATALRQTGRPEPAVPAAPSPPVSTPPTSGVEPEPSPIHWTSPPGLPQPPGGH